MNNKNEIFTMLQTLLVEEFEVELTDITLASKLYEELDLDSIDAVDLMVRLKEITGKKIAPEAFKEVRTIEDVVNAVADLLFEA
jgi:acyl carrier protein